MSRLRAAAALASDVLLRTRRRGWFYVLAALAAAVAAAAVGGTELTPTPQGGLRLSFWFDADLLERPEPFDLARPLALQALFFNLIVGKLSLGSLIGVACGVLATSGAVLSAFQPGRAELILPRPISRGEVVAARFAGALAFAALQAAWLAGLFVLLTGLRHGVWLPSLLLALAPLLLKFSVLAAVATLVGVVARSATLGLGAAGGAWLASWLLNGARATLEAIRAELARVGKPPEEALGGAGPWIEWAQRLAPQVSHHDRLAELVCYPGQPIAEAGFDPLVVVVQGVCWTLGPLLLTSWIVSRRDH